MKRLLTIFLFYLFVLSFPTLVLAADLDINCPVSSTGCSKSGVDPFFNIAVDGYWYPGKSITKTLNLKNSGTETREMAIRGTRTSMVNDLENVMHISIVGGTTVIWAGSVANFYDQDKIGMGTFAPGADFNYDFTVFMSSGADNNYRSKETVFDLTLGFWGESIPTPTPTPTSVGSINGVSTASFSSPTCNDPVPVGAPTLLSVISGINSVTLNWSEGAGPLTYYLIAYGTTSGVYQYGNPNIGGPGTTSYTVGSLSSGQTYYFVVRAGNGCSSGPFSQELSGRPLAGGVVIPPGQIPPGFQPGVLGAQTSLSSTPTVETGSLLGIQNPPSTTCCFWIFSFIALIANIKILYRYRRQNFIKVVFGTLIISLISYLLDKYLSPRFCQNFLQHLPLIKNIFFNNCHLIWLWSLLSFIVPYLLTIFNIV